MLIIDLEQFMMDNAVISYLIFIILVGNLYYGILSLLKKISKRKPFSIDLYNTGKYRVVTRNGHNAEIEATEPELIVNIPTQPDCRGRFRYGYLPIGRRHPSNNDELDLFLIKK